MIIEKLTCKDDYPIIINLDKKLFDYDNLTIEDLEKYPDNIYVLKSFDKIVGFYIYYMKEDVCYLETLEVDLEYRNKGYSKLLLEHFLKQGNKFELHCKTDNMPALILYSSNKFNMIKIEENFYDDGSDAFLMRR